MMYLTIDSKNPDYQFVHIDINRNYGVACKFKFYEDGGNETFTITHSVVIKTGPGGPSYHSVNSLSSTTQASADANYKYQINADLTQDPDKIPGEEREDSKNNAFIRKTDGEPKKEHIIDLHILSHPDGTIDIKPDYGNGYCKFYII